ncbi:sensor histidine kinase [Streptococcus mitis]|jgi:histidine kinase|uniref:histidine kinase n=1 Tax=Streptococcus mitis TaxID=28037 RepID=A0A6L5H509_STRMT|nr:sensor histidine kinase [Streptococcus mitis]MDU4338158.1 sensor histidine kinase [Streptococcus mitis]MQP60039.1 sensor histidine kinase [Streptococcus mitis]MQP69535.1 sensor histidine kinase [Streptococcus mitis]MQP71774.1 sensor histidine kinase [Streptococcus mitis]MQP72762.1 sensor histidine kinase [Streptococcus mitis]
MLERLKSIDYMYWASLIFMVFPIVPVVTGELPSWHLLIDILFVLAYLGVLTTKSQRLSWICWVIMLAYVAGNTAFVGVNYIWFFFFLANLLIYHFGVRSFNSLHVRTFLLAQFLVVGQLLIFQEVEVEFLVYLLGIITFIDVMTFGLVRIRIVEDLKEAQAKQNAQINLLLAENERSRIGQDLHDSLGHTFAMISVKTDLALQLFQIQAYPQVEKELREIQQISKESMREVRTIVENLKSRTLTSELETVKKMLEIAGIEVEIANQLDTASLTQELESTASMILLELVTNIIKHAQASKAYLKLERTEKELILTVSDDGCGFASIKGDEFHTVRDRVLPFSGEVSVISQKHPTEVQVRLPYKERN